MTRLHPAFGRPLLGLILGVLAVLDLHSLASALRWHARVRDRAAARARTTLGEARARWEPLFAGGQDVATSLRTTMVIVGASRGEAFTPEGQPVAAAPEPSTANEWPSALEMERVMSGEAVGIVSRDARSVLSFALVRAGPSPLVLRLATPAPDLGQDLRERKELFLVQGLALLLIVVAGALVASARGAPPPETSVPTALFAYEEAMERLRTHGEEANQRHERERRQLTDRVEDSDAMARAGELTAAIVHEVRNGLGTIVAYAKLIERGGGAAAEHGRAIREECETLETVVRRFIEFVRRETLNVAPFDLARLLSRVAARESRGRPGAPVAVSAPEGLAVTGDEELLERAFENLVRNAREAAGAAGQVWVTAEAAGDAAEVLIEDDGPGLPASARPRAFTTSKAGGLGLGLPIALKIVRLHGGELSLEPRAPRGLRVRARWPRSVSA